MVRIKKNFMNLEGAWFDFTTRQGVIVKLKIRPLSYGLGELLRIRYTRLADLLKKNQREIQDAELAHQLAIIELQEKSFEISKAEAGGKRIALKEQELANLRQI